jgi:ribosome-associated translation inhibitor RaiA
MYFQVRTDNHVVNSEGFAEWVRSEVEPAVARFGDRLRRLEVYVRDMNSHKGGVDKRCSIEAHLSGRQPVAVHADAPDLGGALDGAVEKLTRALEHALGKLADRGRASASGQES